MNNNRQRYVLEGEWSGYTSSQQRIVHREVVVGKRVDRLKNLHSVKYTDGTYLYVHLRPAKYREKVIPMLSYSSLIREAEKSGNKCYEVQTHE